MTDDAQSKADTRTQTGPCTDLPKPPEVPEIPERDPCTHHCECPPDPSGPPADCFDKVIQDQNSIVKKAERAKALVEELTALQAKVTSAQADYTQDRYNELKNLWGEQDKSINELIRKVVCAVGCWECLLACRLCNRLTEVRKLEEELNGPGDLDKNGMGLPKEVNSLYDRQYWYQRSVANMQSRVDRIKRVLAAWEKPSDTLGEVLEKNGKLIEDLQKIIATDPLKAVFDLFMTLLPRHWAIRPRDVNSAIDKKYFQICECHEEPPAEGCDQQTETTPKEKKCKCDEGTPDDCCGPDAGVLNLRQRLIGPLPYLVDPKKFSEVVCCLTKYRLTPASDLLAAAQAELAAVTAEIDQAKKTLEQTTTSVIEAAFRAGLPTPFDCAPYESKHEQKPAADSKAQAR